MATAADFVLLDRLRETSRVFAEGHGLTVNEASNKLFGNPRRLGKLNRSENPHDLSSMQYAVAMAIMSKSWPSAAAWPEGIERPGL